MTFSHRHLLDFFGWQWDRLLMEGFLETLQASIACQHN